MSGDNNIEKLFFLKRWQFCCLLFFIESCTTNTASHNKPFITTAESIKSAAIVQRAIIQITEIEKSIQVGDLITRSGNDFTSESLQKINQHDKTYSHCGIASIENDTVFVYHALGGEFNPDQKIRRDPFILFCEPYTNRGIGIFRFKLTRPEIKNTVTTAKKYYQSGVMFDMKFDLQTNDRMYCSEFVYKSFFEGTQHNIQFTTSHIKTFTYIGIDDLFMNPACIEIKRIMYK